MANNEYGDAVGYDGDALDNLMRLLFLQQCSGRTDASRARSFDAKSVAFSRWSRPWLENTHRRPNLLRSTGYVPRRENANFRLSRSLEEDSTSRQNRSGISCARGKYRTHLRRRFAAQIP